MERKNLNYKIRGRIGSESLKKIGKRIPLKVYAIQNRMVLGSGPVKDDGEFEIRYNLFAKNNEASGVDLVFGPDLPRDQVLKIRLPRKFISASNFKKQENLYVYELPIVELSEVFLQPLFIFNFKHEMTYVGFVYTCLPLTTLNSGQESCMNPLALSSVDEIAFARISTASKLIVEDIEIDITGRFTYTDVWYDMFFYIYPMTSQVTLEIYQKTDQGDHSLYKNSRQFVDNVPQFIYLDRGKTEIIHRPPEPTLAQGSFFGFDRIGNIPTACIYEQKPATKPPPPSNDFIGYVDSIPGDIPNVQLGDADFKVKDYAFGGTLHFYVNLGENFGNKIGTTIIDMEKIPIKYFRILYSYQDKNGQKQSEYINSIFDNTRKIQNGTATERMGPFTTPPNNPNVTVAPYYIFPNPYEIDPDKNWLYRGMVLAYNTLLLPTNYGRYKFTIEPLDENLSIVNYPGTQNNIKGEDCELTLAIDNDFDALKLKITNVSHIPEYSFTPACGIMDFTKTAENKSVAVDFSVVDDHGNLRDFSLKADYGLNDVVHIVDWTSYVRPLGANPNPYWSPGSQTAQKVQTGGWTQCAYSFNLQANRRVTDGFTTTPTKEFTYSLTILSLIQYYANQP